MQEKHQIKLEALRIKYAADFESQQYIDKLEAELRKLFEDQKLADNPLFQAIVKDAQQKLDELNALLCNDRTLTEIDRASIFRAKEIWKFVLDRFGLKSYDRAIELLEKTIDEKLEM